MRNPPTRLPGSAHGSSMRMRRPGRDFFPAAAPVTRHLLRLRAHSGARWEMEFCIDTRHRRPLLPLTDWCPYPPSPRARPHLPFPSPVALHPSGWEGGLQEPHGVARLLASEETLFTVFVFGSAAALRREQWRVEHAAYCVIHPYSPFRKFCVVFMFGVSVLTLFTTPIDLAFGEELNNLYGMFIFSLVSNELFLIDLILNFRLGVITGESKLCDHSGPKIPADYTPCENGDQEHHILGPVASVVLKNAWWVEQYSFSVFRALSHIFSIGYGSANPPAGVAEVWLTITSADSGYLLYMSVIANVAAPISSADPTANAYRDKEVKHHLCARLVKKVPLFQHCDLNFLNAVIMHLSIELFQPREVIITEGSCGELFLFKECARSMTVTALTMCRLFSLSGDELKELLETYPEIGEQITKCTICNCESLIEPKVMQQNKM